MILRHRKNSNRIVPVRGYAGFLILLSAPFLLGAGENDRTAVEENRQQREGGFDLVFQVCFSGIEAQTIEPI